MFKAGFRHEALTLDGSGGAGFDSAERLPVVVLPGIMGSELIGPDGVFWPNVAKALRNPELAETPPATATSFIPVSLTAFFTLTFKSLFSFD